MFTENYNGNPQFRAEFEFLLKFKNGWKKEDIREDIWKPVLQENINQVINRFKNLRHWLQEAD